MTNIKAVGPGQGPKPSEGFAVTRAFKDFVQKIQYFVARYFGSNEEKEIISIIDTRHLEIINLSNDVDDIVNNSARTIDKLAHGDSPADDKSAVLERKAKALANKLTYTDQLPIVEKKIEELNHKLEKAGRQTVAGTHFQRQLNKAKDDLEALNVNIGNCTQQIKICDERISRLPNPKVGIDIAKNNLENIKGSLLQQKQTVENTNNPTLIYRINKEIELIDQQLEKLEKSESEIKEAKTPDSKDSFGKMTLTSLTEPALRQGVNITAIVYAFPSDENIEENINRVFKALENKDITGNNPKELEKNLNKLRSLNIEPSVYLYKLSQEIKKTDDDTNETKLSQKIHKEISWLTTQLTTTQDGKALLTKLKRLQSEGIEPIGALLAITDVKAMNVTDIINRLPGGKY